MEDRSGATLAEDMLWKGPGWGWVSHLELRLERGQIEDTDGIQGADPF